MPKPEGKNVLSNSAAADFRRMQKIVLGAQDNQGAYGGGAHPISGKKYWGKVVSSLASGSISSPTTCTVDIWLPDPSLFNPTPPYSYLRATDDNLLGITVVNRLGYSTSGNSGSSAGFGSSSSSTGTDCRVEYDAGEWNLLWMRQTVVTGVACSGSGLSVTYGAVG